MQQQKRVKTSIYLDRTLYSNLCEISDKEHRTLTFVLNRTLEDGLKHKILNETELNKE